MEKYIQKPEQKRERGEDITIRVVVVRHGEKEYDPNDPNTGLTFDGEWDAKVYGQARPRVDAIKGYSSSTERTDDTRDNIAQESLTEKKLRPRNRDDLVFHYDPNGQFIKDVMRIKQEIVGPHPENLTEEEMLKRSNEAVRAQTDHYLSFGDQRPDSGTYSPAETAASIAHLLEHYKNMSKRLNSGSDVDLINATHDFNISAFLSQVLVREVDGERVVGFDSMDDIGGGIEYTEAFEVTIERCGGQDTMKLIFRDKECEIDEQRFTELLDIHKQLINEAHE